MMCKLNSSDPIPIQYQAARKQNILKKMPSGHSTIALFYIMFFLSAPLMCDSLEVTFVDISLKVCSVKVNQ